MFGPGGRTHTCQRTVDLLQDLLPQEVDQPGDDLATTTWTVRPGFQPQEEAGAWEAPAPGGRGEPPPTWGNFLLMELRAPSGNLASSESRTA